MHMSFMIRDHLFYVRYTGKRGLSLFFDAAAEPFVRLSLSDITKYSDDFAHRIIRDTFNVDLENVDEAEESNRDAKRLAEFLRKHAVLLSA